MQYEDFKIRFTPRHGNEIRLSILEAPTGEVVEDMALTIGRRQVREFLEALEQALTAKPAKTGSTAPEPTEEPDHVVRPPEIGQALFRALFPQRVRALFDASRGAVETRGDCGLRIQLFLDPNDQTVGWLAGMPWELLHNGGCTPVAHLGLDRRFSIVRRLELPEPQRRRQLPPQLRILAVVASPRGLQRLNEAHEKELLEDAWGNGESARLEILEHPTRRRLLNALSDGCFDIFHFMGHGQLDIHTGEGELYLQDETGEPDALSAHALAPLLRGPGSPLLALLNSCRSGLTGTGARAFNGVAAALVACGVPAVVAMQCKISDRAAISFAEGFHSRLAKGATLDEAVTAGRLAIHTLSPGSFEWAVPVLYSRLGDGQLFHRGETPDRKGEQPAGHAATAQHTPSISEVHEPAPGLILRARTIHAKDVQTIFESSRSDTSNVIEADLVTSDGIQEIGKGQRAGKTSQ